MSTVLDVRRQVGLMVSREDRRGVTDLAREGFGLIDILVVFRRNGNWPI